MRPLSCLHGSLTISTARFEHAPTGPRATRRHTAPASANRQTGPRQSASHCNSAAGNASATCVPGAGAGASGGRFSVSGWSPQDSSSTQVCWRPGWAASTRAVRHQASGAVPASASCSAASGAIQQPLSRRQGPGALRASSRLKAPRKSAHAARARALPQLGRRAALLDAAVEHHGRPGRPARRLRRGRG